MWRAMPWAWRLPPVRAASANRAADSAYSGEIADMEAAALDGTPSRVSLAESRRTAQTILALYASARSGRTVQL